MFALTYMYINIYVYSLNVYTYIYKNKTQFKMFLAKPRWQYWLYISACSENLFFLAKLLCETKNCFKLDAPETMPRWHTWSKSSPFRENQMGDR